MLIAAIVPMIHLKASVSTLTLHVTFGGSKKSITCSTTAELFTTTESGFKPNAANDLQLWDDDFNDWVDIDDISTLNGKSKWEINIFASVRYYSNYIITCL